MNRAPTPEEQTLLRFLLENGKPEARRLLQQVERAQATDWRCTCGCASFNLAFDGVEPQGDMKIVGDFVCSTESGELCGVFVFEKGGVLGGVEIYALAGEAPSALPKPESLRPFVGSAK
jgi:hypothetical protein